MELHSEHLPPVVVWAIRVASNYIPSLRELVRKTSQRYAAQALQSYLSGDLDRAEIIFREAMVWTRDDAELHSSLGQVHYEQDKPKEAEKEFRKALDFDYRNLRALKGLGVVLQERDELLEAMYLYLRYLQLEPRDAVVCHNLGAVFHNLGEYEKAISYYKQAKKEDPDDPLISKNLGLALLDQGQFEEATNLFLEARENAPEDAKIDGLLASALESRGEVKSALQAYESALRKDPNDPGTHLQFAMLASRDGRYRDAVDHSETAAKLYREAGDSLSVGEAYWEAGWAYYMLQDWDKSLAAGTEALKLNPSLTPVYFNLGLVLLQLGRVSEARKQYEEGVSHLSNISDLKEHGIDDLRETLDKTPELPGATEILALLKEKYASLSKDLANSAKQVTTSAS